MNTLQPWKRIEPTKQTKVGWRTIVSKTFILPDGTKAVFDTLHPDGQEFAGVVALTPDNQVIVTRQYRSGPEKIMDDLPGGFVDKGETPEVAMRRELTEETGYQAGEVTYLGAYHKDIFMNATWHAFLARNCVKVAEPKTEETEHIEQRLISIDQLIHNATHDMVQDHGLVLMAYDKLLALR